MIMNINFKSHSVLQLYFTSKISEKQVLNQHSVTWTLQNKLCRKRFCFQWTLPSFPCPIWTEYPAQVTLKWYSCFLGLREGEGLVGRSSTRGNKNKNKAKRLKKKHTFLLKSYSMLVGKSEYLDDSGTVIYNFWASWQCLTSRDLIR